MTELAGRFREGAVCQNGKVLGEFANGGYVERKEVTADQGLGIVCGNVFRSSRG
jgi:flagellar hook protein FlgE